MENREKIIILKAEGFGVVRGGFMLHINLKDNGFPLIIKGEDIKKYFKAGDIISYDDVDWEIIGVESHMSVMISSVGLLLKKADE